MTRQPQFFGRGLRVCSSIPFERLSGKKLLKADIGCMRALRHAATSAAIVVALPSTPDTSTEVVPKKKRAPERRLRHEVKL
jgi:hypothetical protein